MYYWTDHITTQLVRTRGGYRQVRVPGFVDHPLSQYALFPCDVSISGQFVDHPGSLYPRPPLGPCKERSTGAPTPRSLVDRPGHTILAMLITAPTSRVAPAWSVSVSGASKGCA